MASAANRDRLRGHLLRLAVDQVAGGVAGRERELVDDEPPRGRRRVRPRHVPVKADADRGKAEQRSAHHVVAARDGQVREPEPLGATPREVRVGQHHSVASPGGQATQRDAVRAQRRIRRVAQDVAQRVDVGAGARAPGGGRSGRGRLRVDEPGDQARGGLQGGDLDQAQEQVADGDRLDPRLALAARVAQPARAQEGVVAGHPSPVHGPDLVRRAPRRALPGQPEVDTRVADPLPEHVRLDVGVRRSGRIANRERLGPEVPRPLGPEGDDVVGERAQVVLGERIPLPIADRAEVVSAHVRNAGAVADNRNAIARSLAFPRHHGHHRGGEDADANQLTHIANPAGDVAVVLHGSAIAYSLLV